MVRDFTYVDDIVDSIFKLTNKIPKKIILKNKIMSPFQVLNIGSNNPINIKKYIKFIEHFLNKKAKVKNYPMQKGDVKYTHADLNKLKKVIKTRLKITNLKKGIHNFIKWHEQYYD